MPRLLSLVACMAAAASALTDVEFDWIVGPLAGPPDTVPLAPVPSNLTSEAIRTARLFAKRCKISMESGAPEARLHFDFDQTLSVRHVTMELLKLSKHGIDHTVALYEMDVRAKGVESFTKLDKASRASSLWAFGTQTHVDNLIELAMQVRQACGPNSKIVVNTKGYIGPVMYLLAGATDSNGVSLLDVFDLVGGKGSSRNTYASKESGASSVPWCENRGDLPAQPDQHEEALEYFANLRADDNEFLPYETDSDEHCEACATVRYLMAAMAIDKSAGHVRGKAKMFDDGSLAQFEVIIDDSVAQGFLGQLKLDTASDMERANVGRYQLDLLRNYLVEHEAKPMPQLHWGISAGEGSWIADDVGSTTLRVFADTLAGELGANNLGATAPWFQHVPTPVQMPALVTVHFGYAPARQEPTHARMTDAMALRYQSRPADPQRQNRSPLLRQKAAQKQQNAPPPPVSPRHKAPPVPPRPNQPEPAGLQEAAEPGRVALPRPERPNRTPPGKSGSQPSRIRRRTRIRLAPRAGDA